MFLLIAFLIIPLASMILIPFIRENRKWATACGFIIVNSLISGYFAVQSLIGQSVNFLLSGSLATGSIPIRIDALSGWFILIINLVFITGAFYGLFYLKANKAQRNNLSLHAISFLLQHAAILSICAIQNSLVFLICMEILALVSFLVIIFEHEKIATIRAGINYLIQAHFSILFLMVGFIWVAQKTGSYDFNAITSYTASVPAAASIFLFVFFFTGFAFKAGFVPFHTWLPYAHPAAPSHVSGMMSGVIIKIGIFGILRMLLVFRTDFVSVGYFILIISVISGLYGVMLAIVQHNLKKLLAYHSIENIGIIGIGIGLGCIGIGTGNHLLTTLGFAGALLHTLNHALFKSLLFYTAGNVYQATHTMDIEKLGGLIRKMPQTAGLFLVAAIAISGIPPFNGFISEFIIYTGLYNWLGSGTLVSLVAAILTITGLVLIGGLAMLCFTKAFGVVFLGTERSTLPKEIKEVPFNQLLPLYFLAAVILLIGVFPQVFIQLLSRPVNLFTGNLAPSAQAFQSGAFSVMQSISWAAWGLILVASAMFALRKFVLRNRKVETGPTWGCGYVSPTAKQQYTAGSFVRTYTKLFRPFLITGKEEEIIEGVFPQKANYSTHPYDKIEKWAIDKPLKFNKSLMGRFLFLHNGKLQFYILYGVIFILSVMAIPVVFDKIQAFVVFIKQL